MMSDDSQAITYKDKQDVTCKSMKNNTEITNFEGEEKTGELT